MLSPRFCHIHLQPMLSSFFLTHSDCLFFLLPSLLSLQFHYLPLSKQSTDSLIHPHLCISSVLQQRQIGLPPSSTCSIGFFFLNYSSLKLCLGLMAIFLLWTTVICLRIFYFRV